MIQFVQDKRFELTPTSDLQEFLAVMKDDRRTANIDIDILQLIFERVSTSSFFFLDNWKWVPDEPPKLTSSNSDSSVKSELPSEMMTSTMTVNNGAPLMIYEHILNALNLLSSWETLTKRYDLAS